jgi:transposase
MAVLVVNAAPSKAVPGRKTDGRDAPVDRRPVAPRLAPCELPPRPAPCHALRALTRSRTTRIPERAHAVNRRQQVLAGATSTLASVATALLGRSGRDLLGRSGRAMLAALVGGTPEAAALG